MLHPKSIISKITCDERVSTTNNLVKKGFQVVNRCISCAEEETVEHLFFNCSYVCEVWEKVFASLEVAWLFRLPSKTLASTGFIIPCSPILLLQKYGIPPLFGLGSLEGGE
ncbi:hypothetical protein SUGI_1029260 [Cryptomeria japonica]|nr:hypothetical protein SUGI_1029260 [Cryptomeria japonica]